MWGLSNRSKGSLLPLQASNSDVRSVDVMQQCDEEAIQRLRPYQKDGVSFLLSSSAALLADEMGLGKTVQAATALRIGRSILRRVLLVTPSSLTLNWESELRRWAPEISVRRVVGSQSERFATYRLPVNLLICSYEQVRLDIQAIYSLPRFNLVVLDEAQRIKNVDSETSLACRLLPRDRSWALSGTPIENSRSDLYSIFRFLQPNLLRDWMSLPEVHTAICGYFLRRTKAEVLAELPPIIQYDISVEMIGQQLSKYQELWNSRFRILGSGGDSARRTNLLGLLTKLKTLCNYEEESGESVKLDVLTTVLDEVSGRGEKVLIFSQFVTTLMWLTGRLRVPSDLLHGALSLKERENVVSRFRGSTGPRALLVSLRAGGVGLNLQEASTVVLFDRWWNPATENQAMQRAHRFGKNSPLRVIRFIVENSIERRIVEILGSKQEVFDDYIANYKQGTSVPASRSVLNRILDVQEQGAGTRNGS